ncbi:MAG: GNAT family N-acetyltransferase [Bacteroidota bacterium]|jgi:L-amino acid N-acyltransferase YncA
MILLRDAELTDAAAIAEIYNESILNSTATFDTETKTTEDRKAWLMQHNAKYPVVVAEISGTVVGFASLSRWSERTAYDNTAEISIYISPEHRSKGIGKKLITMIMEKGRNGGLHCLLSRITEGNEHSIYLHTQAGFTTIGVMREVGEKFGRILDVTLMQFIY